MQLKHEKFAVPALLFLLLSATLAGQPCQTILSDLGAEEVPFAAEEGSPETQLTLFPLTGDAFSFPRSGELAATTTPGSAFLYRTVGAARTCDAVATDAMYSFEAIPLIPTESGEVFIRDNVGGGLQTNAYRFTLFSGAFDPGANNCDSLVASSFVDGANGSLIIADLDAGRRYTLVIQRGESATDPYPRNYNLAVARSTGVTVPTLTYYGGEDFAAGYEYTYVAVEDDGDADPSNDFVRAESATGDFSSLTEGIYYIYGLNYDPAAVNPTAFVNDTRDLIEDPANCAQLSREGSRQTLNVTEAASAPVDWLTFTATATDGAVHLDWDVASETENDYFRIERSARGETWIDIGEVAGNGTTQRYAAFVFTDGSPLSGSSYYRLAQVDFDGTVNYSATVAVEVTTADQAAALNTFPNPFDNLLTVTAAVAPTSVPRLYDLNGRELTVRTTVSAQGDRAELQTTQLPVGVYLVVWGDQRLRVFKR